MFIACGPEKFRYAQDDFSLDENGKDNHWILLFHCSRSFYPLGFPWAYMAWKTSMHGPFLLYSWIHESLSESWLHISDVWPPDSIKLTTCPNSDHISWTIYYVTWADRLNQTTERNIWIQNLNIVCICFFFLVNILQLFGPCWWFHFRNIFHCVVSVKHFPSSHLLACCPIPPDLWLKIPEDC